ncbi:MAG TPA: FMN-binding protein [Agromyces sp.]|nr:FMN-binding protein [Agromyces sp.]
MRTRALILASAASATALLAGWQLGALGSATAPVAESTQSTDDTGATDTSASSSGTDTSGTSPTSSDPAAPTDSTTTDTSTATAPSTDGTYAGTTVSTRFGDVQVQVTISGGAISDVTALQLTDHDGRSVAISNQAEPILRDEVLQAQSASVSMVGGATYTSAAYLQSLQAALDEAGF